MLAARVRIQGSPGRSLHRPGLQVESNLLYSRNANLKMSKMPSAHVHRPASPRKCSSFSFTGPGPHLADFQGVEGGGAGSWRSPTVASKEALADQVHRNLFRSPTMSPPVGHLCCNSDVGRNMVRSVLAHSTRLSSHQGKLRLRPWYVPRILSDICPQSMQQGSIPASNTPSF